MKALIHDFSEYLRIEKRYSPHTVSGYCRDLGRFSNFASDRKVDSLSTSDIREFLIYLGEQGLSGTSIARCLSSIKSFFLTNRLTIPHKLVPSSSTTQLIST